MIIDKLKAACYHIAEVITMRLLQRLTNERFARSAAGVVKGACYFVIGFLVLCTVLSFLGRQTFTLHSKTGTYERAICAEEDHGRHSRSMTVYTGDDIHVWTDDSDQIEPAVRIGLSLLYAVNTIPMVLAFWLLSRVFSNVQNGRIFIEQNASFLLYYGLIQFFAAVFVPFIKLAVCGVVSRISDGGLSIGTGGNLFEQLFPSIAFLVAAYIIHYGVHLQDEVDHTL